MYTFVFFSFDYLQTQGSESQSSVNYPIDRFDPIYLVSVNMSICDGARCVLILHSA